MTLNKNWEKYHSQLRKILSIQSNSSYLLNQTPLEHLLLRKSHENWICWWLTENSYVLWALCRLDVTMDLDLRLRLPCNKHAYLLIGNCVIPNQYFWISGHKHSVTLLWYFDVFFFFCFFFSWFLCSLKSSSILLSFFDLLLFACNFRDAEYANVDWDNLGFGLVPTDYMYIMKCSKGESFEQGQLIHFGNIQLSPAAGVLNYGQVSCSWSLFKYSNLKTYKNLNFQIVGKWYVFKNTQF